MSTIFASASQQLAERPGECFLTVLAALLPCEATTQRLQALADDLRCLVEHRIPGTRQLRLHQRHVQGSESRHAHRRLPRLQAALGVAQMLLWHREGNDLDGGKKLASRHPRIRRQGGHRHGLVHPVHGIQPSSIRD